MRSKKHQQGYVLVTVMAIAFLVAAVVFLTNRQSAIGTNIAAGYLEADEARYVAEAGLQHALWQTNQASCSNYTNLSGEPFGDHSYSVDITPTDGSPVALQSTATLAGGAKHSFTWDSVPVYDTSAPMTGVLTTSAGGKDTFIEGESGHRDHNKGNNAELKISSEIGKEYKTLLQFDLSGLPTNATVQSATLELDVKTHNSTEVVEGHRLLRDWTEGGVTWNDHDGTNAWGTPGGDYDPDIAGSVLVDGTGLKTMDISALAKAWASGAQPNYGLILLSPPAAGGNENKFHSSDQSGNPEPRLVLTYVCECGAPCPGLLAGQNLYLSTDSPATLGGLSFDDIDLAEYDPVADSATLFFAGAPTTLNSDIDALHVLANGHLLLSTKDDDDLGGLNFKDGDLIDYDPVSDTATLFFDESLFSANEDIISVYLMDNGHLLLSTDSNATLGGLSFADEDLVEYDPESDNATLFLDGSTTTLSSDITAVHLWANGHILLSTKDAATLGGLSFDDGDLVQYDPATDVATLYFDEDAFSADEDIISVHIGPGSGGTTATAPKKLLFVVGNEGSPTAEELAHQTLIESWGYTVELIDDDASQADFDTAAANNDIAFTTNDIIASRLNTKLADATIGVVTSEVNLADEFGMAGAIDWDGGTTLDIVDNSHYITMPFSIGSLTVLSTFESLAHVDGSPAPDLAILAKNNEGSSIVALDASGTTYTGGSAAGRRVMLPWGGTPSLDPNDLTADGVTILRRALEWGVGTSSLNRLLFVVIDAASLNSQDDAKIALLESWGYTVSVIDDDDSQSTYDTAVAANDVVYISEDAWSGSIGTKLVSAPIGIVTEEVNLNDEFGLSDGVNWESGTQITIDDNSHYITQPFATGPMTVLTAPELFHYLTPAISPDLGHLGSSPSGTVLATLDAGAAMVGGGATAGRRVQLPWGADNFELSDLTADGLTLFQRALEWASGSGAGPGNNDAEQLTSDGTMYIDSTDLELADNLAATLQATDIVGIRFPNVAVPQGETVTSAYIQFQVDELDSGAASLTIEGESVDDASAFNSTPYDISSRPRTTASVLWTPPVWTTVGARGPDQRTADLSPIVQELVNRPGWTEGNAIVFIISGSGTRTAESYEGDPAGKPEFHVQYGGGGGGGCDGTFRDEFNARVYSNSDGTLNWATDWGETGESLNPTGGDIRVDDDIDNYQLQVRDDGQTVWREVDLSTAGSATLSFDYRRQNLSGSNDYVAVEVSYNGGSSWTELDRFTGTATDGSYISTSYPLNAGSLSSNTRIRFLTPNSGMSNSNMVWFDNIEIACSP